MSPAPISGRMQPPTTLALLLLTALPWLAAGCGYTFVQDGRARRSVAVHVADNRSFRQRIEIPLTRRLHEQLPVLGPYVPAAHEDAEVDLYVEIVDIEGQTLAGAGRTPVREGALDFAIHARLLDRESGREMRNVRIIDRAEFRVAIGETEQSAIEEAAYDIARKITLALDRPD